MKSVVRIFIVLLVSVLLFDLLFTGGGILVIPFYLLAGWLFFLKRTLPDVTFHAGGIALTVLCSALIIVGIQWFAAWFYSRNVDVTNAETTIPQRKWKWQWTLGMFCFVCLLFVSSIASTGVLHQVGWLLSSDEPLFVNRHERMLLISDLSQICGGMIQAAQENQWKPTETTSAWTNNDYLRPTLQQSLHERWHILCLENENKKFAAVIFHRDPKIRAKLGFGLVVEGTEHTEILPKEKLPETLKRFGITSIPIIPTTNRK